MLDTFGLVPLQLQLWLEQIEIASTYIAKQLDQVLFFSIGGMPLIILWIFGAAVFFTLRLGLINFWVFGHAIAVLQGQYDDPDDEGEISHFQALATALSAALIPALCVIYVIAVLWVLLVNATAVPGALSAIVHGAFSPTAVEGGAVGVMVQGLRWSVFSNGAGTGSAAIAHAAACTKEPRAGRHRCHARAVY